MITSFERPELNKKNQEISLQCLNDQTMLEQIEEELLYQI